MRQAVLWTGVLLFLVVMAGCLGVPFGEPTPQEEPAPVMLVNNASMTETFEVAVVEVGEEMTIYGQENFTENISVGQGSQTLKKPLLRVELPESARIHGEYTLEPGERKQLEIENVAPNEAIVILIYDEPEGTYRAIKSLSCGGPILGYKVTSQAEGENQTLSQHQCGFS